MKNPAIPGSIPEGADAATPHSIRIVSPSSGEVPAGALHVAVVVSPAVAADTVLTIRDGAVSLGTGTVGAGVDITLAAGAHALRAVAQLDGAERQSPSVSVTATDMTEYSVALASANYVPTGGSIDLSGTALDVASGGILLCGWGRAPAAAVPFEHGNLAMFDLFFGSSNSDGVRVACVTNNVAVPEKGSVACRFNANTMVLANNGAQVGGDTTLYAPNSHTVEQVGGWVFSAWHIGFSATGITLRQWLKFGDEQLFSAGPQSDVATADVAAVLGSFAGFGHPSRVTFGPMWGDGIDGDVTRLRVYATPSVTMQQIEAVAAIGAADTTSALAAWLILDVGAYYFNGALQLVDRSPAHRQIAMGAGAPAPGSASPFGALRVNAGVDQVAPRGGTVTLEAAEVGAAKALWLETSANGNWIESPGAPNTRIRDIAPGQTSTFQRRLTSIGGQSVSDSVSVTAPHFEITALPARTIVVIGDSNPVGVGTTTGHSWVEHLRNYIQARSPGSQVVNLAIGATSSDRLVLWGGDGDIAHALAVPGRNAVIMASSGNDQEYAKNSGTLDTVAAHVQANFLYIQQQCVAAGVPLWMSTTYPRKDLDLVPAFLTTWAWVMANAQHPFDFYSGLVDSQSRMLDRYDSGDAIHLNNLAHDTVLWPRIANSGLLETIFGAL